MSQLLESSAPLTLPEAPPRPGRTRPRRPRPAEPGRPPETPTEPGDQGDLPGTEPERLKAPAEGALADAELIEAAHEIAKRLYGCWELSQRIAIYKEVGKRFGSEHRRVLNIAAARWPELITTVNDLPEWKALLSADLS